ncbi:MAG: hypothetical protein MK134_13055, partial [Dehalococcoidia bacterium]|nr:hypothetical protein [Dehalococcoidia bacterium]
LQRLGDQHCRYGFRLELDRAGFLPDPLLERQLQGFPLLVDRFRHLEDHVGTSGQPLDLHALAELRQLST